MTGTTVGGVGGTWVWGCGGTDVDECEVAVSEDDGWSADVDGSIAIVGIGSKPSNGTVDDAMSKVGGPDAVMVVVIVAPPGTKAGRKFAYRYVVA